jgi:hypothetical protein
MPVTRPPRVGITTDYSPSAGRDAIAWILAQSISVADMYAAGFYGLVRTAQVRRAPSANAINSFVWLC